MTMIAARYLLRQPSALRLLHSARLFSSSSGSGNSSNSGRSDGGNGDRSSSNSDGSGSGSNSNSSSVRSKPVQPPSSSVPPVHAEFKPQQQNQEQRPSIQSSAQFNVATSAAELACQSFFAAERPLFDLHHQLHLQQLRESKAKEHSNHKHKHNHNHSDSHLHGATTATATTATTVAEPGPHPNAVRSMNELLDFLSKLKPFTPPDEALSIRPPTAAAADTQKMSTHEQLLSRHPLTSRLPGMVPDEASIPEGLSMGILSSKYLPSTVVGGPSLSSRTMAESDPSRTSRSHRSQRNTVNSAQDAHHMVTSFFAIKRMRSLKRRSLRRWLSVTSSSRRRLRRYRRHTISLCRVTDTHVDASTYHSWWTVIDTMRQIRNKQDGRYAVIRSRRIKSSRM